jgi:hypothetical protein
MTAKHYNPLWLWALGCCLAVDGTAALSASTLAPWVGVSLDGERCSGREISYGPFDYTNAANKGDKLNIVETYHYTKDIQMLIKGNTDYLGEDLDYTVTAFPNHHKALGTLMHYQLIYQHDIATKAKRPLPSPVECYFQRAIHFAPQDPLNYIMYGTYLRKIQHPQEANELYKKALQALPNELSINYSYGLFLFESKKYPEALAQAKLIYAQNFPKQKLKELLIKSGHWQK